MKSMSNASFATVSLLTLCGISCQAVGTPENPYPSYSGTYKLVDADFATESFPSLASAIAEARIPEKFKIAQGYINERQGIDEYPVVAYVENYKEPTEETAVTGVLFSGNVDGQSLIRLDPWAGGISHDGEAPGERCYTTTETRYHVIFEPSSQALAQAYFPCDPTAFACADQEENREENLHLRAEKFNALPASITVNYQILARNAAESCGGSSGPTGGGFSLKYVKQTAEENANDRALLSDEELSALEAREAEYLTDFDLRARKQKRASDPEPQDCEYDRVQGLPSELRVNYLFEKLVRGF